MLHRLFFYVSAFFASLILLYSGPIFPAWSSVGASEPPGYSQFPCGYFKTCAYDAMINGTTYTILYNIIGEQYGDPEGVKLISITENTNFKAISVQIETDQDGTFRIKIPQTALDALGLERDADLIVLADGEEIRSGNAAEDNMVIKGGDFSEGTREILIGDSRIIPEFSSIAIAVAAVALAGVVIVGQKTVNQKSRKR